MTVVERVTDLVFSTHIRRICGRAQVVCRVNER